LPVDHRLRGIVWMLATMLCFITLDAIMKYAMDFYPLVQVTWARFFFATIFAALLCRKNLLTYAQTQRPMLHSGRAILLMITTGLFNAGVWQMPLATATSIMFLSPILVTMLSIFLLSEHVGIRRWLSIAVGFAGALIIVSPWNEAAASLGTGPLFLLAAALTNALYQITTRQLRGDHHLTMLLYTASAGAIITSALVPWHWQTPDIKGWALLIGSGAAGCLGHLCIIKAFQSAPASVVAPFGYSSLIWATLFGVTIWQEWPGLNTWIGAGLIILAGLYIFFRERKLKGQTD
jgi:drug/metabolite transporter (DMT)-like permease